MFEHHATWTGSLNTDTQDIARGLRQRDLDVVRALVGQYQYRLVRYFIYLLGRRDPVDDLVQETWLRVLERGSSYNAASRFEPWLFAIARNLAIDHLRKRRVVSLDSHESPEADLAAMAPVSHAPSPFETAARTEDARRLAHSLHLLEPIYREALVLRFQEELSLQEMADLTGVSVSTVSSRVYRGLAALRAQLDGGTHAS
jgi:RNA polymerase sigma-70 factor, ECF subfamily